MRVQRLSTLLLLSSALIVTLPAAAQTSTDTPPDMPPAAADTPEQQSNEIPSRNGGLDDIVVTATKRGEAQSVQDVPFAVTAFGSNQLDEQHIRSIAGLSYDIPNVQLTELGTAPGYANFSIRGLGINSSIPSIDPTVGTFIDGVYLGVGGGVVLDTFDLAGVEVLRGPQGLLFGRNVTGGAVVIRSTVPSNTFHVDFKAALSTGLEKNASIVVSGPLVQDKLQAKLAVYYNYDNGWFTNQFNNNKNFGRDRTMIVRPVLRWTPTSDVEAILRFEHGAMRGDGARPTNFGLFGANTFNISVNEEGLSRNLWNQLSLETNFDVGFGNGKITNIAAYRDFKGDLITDLDATPRTDYHFYTHTDQNQFSNELRYAGTFGRVDVTTGLYYFGQQIEYLEKRLLSGGNLTIAGGGVQNQHSYGAFASFDWHLTDQITLNIGGRYSNEDKRVRIANIVAGSCNFDARTCNYTFFSKKRWDGFTPRLGVQFKPTDQTQLYGFYARGFRSGGYNLRSINTAVAPGPFDQEVQDSFEIGLKQDFGRVLRVNLAGFHNKIHNVQREIVTPVAGVGAFQVINNAADVTIKGVDAEVVLKVPGTGLSMTGQLGYTDGNYDRIFADLNNDRVIDAKDYALILPRLSKWTYGGSVNYSLPVGDGTIDARGAANYRSIAYYNELNTGILPAATMVDANLAYSVGRYKFSIFGTNLLNEVTFGISGPLPFFAGSTFSALNKGRVIGAEFQYKF
ncbi:TonB-dependent receptor [Sphingomonas sp. KR1UV-12]|uniref:TonB-dependent receptor n=1 Tax=Sphingomonas aurea TaxID=3063994 RepID=A0ABT9EKZ1_9SPHN|nr:TonB-dependent receptor [Sphingomonas sp. KR1UV-12]MDP1027614.1 TonB-dependent receptor [Sphingomonas sp. KR1UV-12]